MNAFGWVVGWAYDADEWPRGYLKRPGNPMVDVQAEAGVPHHQQEDHEAGQDQRRGRGGRLLRATNAPARAAATRSATTAWRAR